MWLDWWHDLLLVKVGCNSDITNVDQLATLRDMARSHSLAQVKASIDSILAAEKQLRQNANPQLVLEVLMITLPAAKRHSEANPLTNLR